MFIGSIFLVLSLLSAAFCTSCMENNYNLLHELEIPENSALVITKKEPTLIGLMNSNQLHIIDALTAHVTKKEKNDRYYLSITADDDSIIVQTMKGLAIYCSDGTGQKIRKIWRAQQNPLSTSQIGLHAHNPHDVVVHTIESVDNSFVHSVEVHSILTPEKYTCAHITCPKDKTKEEDIISRRPLLACHPQDNKIAFVHSNNNILHVKHYVPGNILLSVCSLLHSTEEDFFSILPIELRQKICYLLASFFPSFTHCTKNINTCNVLSLSYRPQSEDLILFTDYAMNSYNTELEVSPYDAEGKKACSCTYCSPLKSVAFYPLNSTIIAAPMGDHIMYQNIISGSSQYNSISSPHFLQNNRNNQKLAFSPNGKKLFIATKNTLLCVDVPEKLPLSTFNRFEERC